MFFVQTYQKAERFSHKFENNIGVHHTSKPHNGKIRLNRLKDALTLNVFAWRLIIKDILIQFSLL